MALCSPGTGESGVTARGDDHSGVRHRAGFKMRGNEVRCPSSLERSGVLHELQDEPKVSVTGCTRVGGGDGDGADMPGDAVAGCLDVTVGGDGHGTGSNYAVRTRK